MYVVLLELGRLSDKACIEPTLRCWHKFDGPEILADGFVLSFSSCDSSLTDMLLKPVHKKLTMLKAGQKAKGGDEVDEQVQEAADSSLEFNFGGVGLGTSSNCSYKVGKLRNETVKVGPRQTKPASP